MGQRFNKKYLTGASIEFTALVALLLAIFTPALNIAAGRVTSQIYLALMLITISALIAITCKRYILFPNARILMLGAIFPTYLLLLSVFNSTEILSLIGQTERHLGAVTYLTCYLFYFVGALLKLNRSGALIRILMIVSCLEIFQFIFNYFKKLDIKNVGVFGNNNAESFFLCVMLVAISIYLIEKLNIKAVKIAFPILIIFISFLLLIFIGSLQGPVGFIVTISLYFVYKVSNQNLNFPRLIGFFMSAALIAFTVVVLLKDIPSKRIVDSNSFYERLEIYKTAISGITQSGFFGVGVDQFNEVYYRYNLSENLKLVDNAHSIPLQLMITVGFFGLLFWSAIFISALRKSPKNLDPESKAMYFSILAYSITGIVAIQVTGIEFIVFLMLGGIMANGAKLTNVRASPIAKWVQVCALTLLLTITSFQFHSYTNVTSLLSQIMQSDESYNKNSEVFLGKLDTIYDLEVLLNAGRRSITIQDKRFGLLVMERMLNVNHLDQRSIALTLELAIMWSDPKLLDLGNSLNVRAKGGEPYEG
jgi:hypothetical protein